MAWTSVVPVTLGLAAASSAADVDADLVVIGVLAPPKEDDAEDDDANETDDDSDPVVPPLTGIAADLDTATGGALTAVLSETAKNFKMGAKLGSATHVVRVVTADGKTTRFAFVGLGPTPKDKHDESDSQKDPYEAAGLLLGKAVAMKCKAQPKITSCQVLLPSTLADQATILTDLSTAFYQTLYVDNRFKTKAKQKKTVPDLATVTILSQGGSEASLCDAAVLETGRQIATGVTLTKDIVNAPHNVLNSESLAETAQRLADDSGGRLTCTILDKAACEERGMGAYLGVARGSETEPQFIHLTYSPPSGTVHKKIAVIGKGLLFDTGGYNIKTQMMEMMKFDCGGNFRS
jgi:leucyl aminopeptidase